LSSKYYEQVLFEKRGIILHEPMHQELLHNFLSSCDIGLALDLPVNRNREIALTNKIIAFVQAGLYVFATNIESQKLFLRNYQGCTIVDIHENDYIAIVNSLVNSISLIRKEASFRYENGSKFNWKIQSEYLLKIWDIENN
jgi:hypothetical protein